MKNVSITSAVSATNLESILIFAGCVIVFVIFPIFFLFFLFVFRCCFIYYFPPTCLYLPSSRALRSFANPDFSAAVAFLSLDAFCRRFSTFSHPGKRKKKDKKNEIQTEIQREIQNEIQREIQHDNDSK